MALTSWWAGKPLAPVGWTEGGLQNGTCQHRHPRGGTSSPEGLCQHLCSQWSPGPPASPGGPPRSLSASDPGRLQIIASALGLGAGVRFCVHPLQTESVPTALRLSCTQAPLAFRAKCFGNCWSWCGTQTPCPLGESPQLGSSSHSWVARPGVQVLAVLHLRPHPPFCCGSFFYPQL